MKYVINKLMKNKTKQEFENDLIAIRKIMYGKDIDDLSIDEMNRLVFLHERSALSYRRLLEYSEKKESDFTSFHKKNRDICNFDSTHFDQNRPIEIEVLTINDQKVIHIFSPFVFKKGLGESFLLAQYLNLALHSNQEDLQMMKGLYKGQKVMAHTIRCATSFNPSEHCDNDNLETSELINTLFSNLKISDSPLKSSFLSDFVLVNSEDEEGMHIILTPYSMAIYGEKLLKMIEKIR